MTPEWIQESVKKKVWVPEEKYVGGGRGEGEVEGGGWRVGRVKEGRRKKEGGGRRKEGGGMRGEEGGMKEEEEGATMCTEKAGRKGAREVARRGGSRIKNFNTFQIWKQDKRAHLPRKNCIHLRRLPEGKREQPFPRGKFPDFDRGSRKRGNHKLRFWRGHYFDSHVFFP
jgi:hypothetical protein